MADAFEALVGAIYLDGGFTKVQRFIHTEFTELLTHADAGRHTGNPKGELQEILQGKRPQRLDAGCWRWKDRPRPVIGSLRRSGNNGAAQAEQEGQRRRLGVIDVSTRHALPSCLCGTRTRFPVDLTPASAADRAFLIWPTAKSRTIT